jgi:hypothetical protein
MTELVSIETAIKQVDKAASDPSSSLLIESTSRLNNRLLELLIDPATRESDKTAVAD